MKIKQQIRLTQYPLITYHVRVIGNLVLAISLYLVSAKEVYAYLDPGTGSYFFQVIIGTAIGFLFSLKFFWRKLLSFFQRSKANESAHPKK